MTNESYLDGQLLIAMPTMEDPRFKRSVIFICSHSAAGAMGLVINRPLDRLSFSELLDQLDIACEGDSDQVPVQYGGPVESGRGFVLHSPDYSQDSTVKVGEEVALTATVDVLRAMASGTGPRQSLLVLGYAGWAPGQLESEIQANGWLHVEADPHLVFEIALDARWDSAVKKLGFDPSFLQSEAGHA
ncbi:YqgE/AlgH family protein [Oceanibacterium hippocampi]|uniref:UPF0301 protein OCH7691_01285 n=1 Tax=Oceanibacterium hippocampi TaxID=745714 RepID=A0A1Y5S634_9PROT|nr:YqgE/AlgH family protein [Oceanibacterium hippocampi]SLN33367.1 hypothetical protein OCH7691_01285 [Oceanibacterium hippocampi]